MVNYGTVNYCYFCEWLKKEPISNELLLKEKLTITYIVTYNEIYVAFTLYDIRRGLKILVAIQDTRMRLIGLALKLEARVTRITFKVRRRRILLTNFTYFQTNRLNIFLALDTNLS